ncbi:MAG: endo-1,4-beta-xylanase [Verrucomicrobiae bacterium]|nr:endo-1,4-beta-xylanase [Verrucomicrobiae bacterium]NNJ43621.1 hypothetical protein [Akkermansiaceae bacterium]
MIKNISTSRRTFLHGLSASSLVALAPRLSAAPMQLPALRQLAGGHPLIGAAVPTHFDKRLNAQEKAILSSQFDSVTPENCMKWQSLCRKQGEYNFGPIDRLVEMAKANKQKVVGHTLIFNRDGNYPDWLFRDGGKEADSKLVWKRVEAHVVKLMTRYKGRIDSWDVLNEFVESHDPGYRVTDFTRFLGKDYPVRLFKLAAEIDPKAKLTYNDFAVENPKRQKAILAFVRSLQDSGCRVDVIGSQSHLEIGDDVGKNINSMIKNFAAIGVRSAFTELDVDVISRKLFWNPKTRPAAVLQNPYPVSCPDEVLQQQAKVYHSVFEAVMANRKNVDRVTMWGITDRNSWLNNWPWKRVNHGLLFDRASAPKPAFHSIAKILARR